MATTPRRWPSEVETEREQIFQEATRAARHLVQVQKLTDTARDKLQANPSLATIQLSEADRSTSDAQASLERIQRCLAVCRGKSIAGRWPIVARDQREEATATAMQATDALTGAQRAINEAIDKLPHNPALVETMIIDITRAQARALMLAERIARLMTEAAMGRD